jgi:hypothetical protein
MRRSHRIEEWHPCGMNVKEKNVDDHRRQDRQRQRYKLAGQQHRPAQHFQVKTTVISGIATWRRRTEPPLRDTGPIGMNARNPLSPKTKTQAEKHARHKEMVFMVYAA